MCLEYYPECGDGGDRCCQRHLNVSRLLAEREAGELPRIYVLASMLAAPSAPRQILSVSISSSTKPRRN